MQPRLKKSEESTIMQKAYEFDVIVKSFENTFQ